MAKQSPVVKKGIYRYYKYMCQYCYNKDATTFDHIVPRSKGGANAFANLMPSCSPCNGKKGDKRLFPTHEAKLLERAGEAFVSVVERVRQEHIRMQRQSSNKKKGNVK